MVGNYESNLLNYFACISVKVLNKRQGCMTTSFKIPELKLITRYEKKPISLGQVKEVGSRVWLYIPDYRIEDDFDRTLLYLTPEINPQNRLEPLVVKVDGDKVSISGVCSLVLVGDLDFSRYYPNFDGTVERYVKELFILVADYLLGDILGLTYTYNRAYELFYQLRGEVWIVGSDGKLFLHWSKLYVSLYPRKSFDLKPLSKVSLNKIISELYHYARYELSVYELKEFVLWSIDVIKTSLIEIRNNFGERVVASKY